MAGLLTSIIGIILNPLGGSTTSTTKQNNVPTTIIETSAQTTDITTTNTPAPTTVVVTSVNQVTNSPKTVFETQPVIAAGSDSTFTLTFISTFITTVQSPPNTFTGIIGIEEPYGITTTITLTGSNTKYYITDQITASAPGGTSGTNTKHSTSTTGRATTSALGTASTSSSSSSLSSSPSGKSRLNGGQIAGVVLGTIAILALLALLLAFFIQRYRTRHKRRVTELVDSRSIGTMGYEKQIAHYSRAPLPSLPNSAHLDGDQQRLSNNSYPKSGSYHFSPTETLAVVRSKLGMSKAQTQKTHVLEWPKEFAASAMDDDIHEGV